MKLKINRFDAKKLTIFMLTGGVCITSYPVRAASIVFDSFTLGKPVIKTTGFAAGSGNSQPNILQAFAAASVNPLRISSFGTQNATTTIFESSFFTVVPGVGETKGSTVKGELFGNLAGILGATGFDLGRLTGSYTASVDANVNAGFASYSSPNSSATSISGSVLIFAPIEQPVFLPFDITGNLVIGQMYPFNMSLTVNASKNGAYQAFSNYQRGTGHRFFANVKVVPEPSSVLGTLAFGVLGLGLLLKRQLTKPLQL